MPQGSNNYPNTNPIGPYRKGKKLTDEELLALARQELETADTQGTNAIRQQRIESFDVYIGELKGRLRNTTGLSAVLLNEHFDYTNRLTTYLLNTIDKEMVTFMTSNVQKAHAAKQLEEMVNYCMMRSNDGFYNFEEWIRSSLIYKTGVVKFWWDETPYSWEEEVTLQDGNIELYVNQRLNESGEDVEIEVIDSDETTVEALEEVTDEFGDIEEQSTSVTSGTYTLRYTAYGRPMWEALPREEFVLNTECVGIRDELTRFVGHRREMMVGDVVSMYPEYFRKLARKDHGGNLVEAATSVATDGDSTSNYDYDYERINRFAWDGSYDVTDSEESTDPMSRRIQMVEGYYKVDYDRTGRLQWLRMVWAGNTVFEKEIVEDHPFCTFCPFPVPHKFDGQSVYDVIGSVMTGMTGLLRSKVDNSVQRNIVRFLVDAQQSKGVSSNLQQGKPGPILVKNLATSGVTVLETPQGANDTVAILQYLDGKIAAKIGISSINDGTNVDLLKSGNDAAKLQIAQSQAGQAVEMYVRRLAETGVKDLVFGFAQMLTQNANSYFVRNLINRMYAPGIPFLAGQGGFEFRKEDLQAKIGVGHKTPQEKSQAMVNVFQLVGSYEQAVGPGSVPTEKKRKLIEDAIKLEGFDNFSDYFLTEEELGELEQAAAQDPMNQAMTEAQQQGAMAEAIKPAVENEKTKSETIENYAQADKAQTDAYANVKEARDEKPFRTQ